MSRCHCPTFGTLPQFAGCTSSRSSAANLHEASSVKRLTHFPPGADNSRPPPLSLSWRWYHRHFLPARREDRPAPWSWSDPRRGGPGGAAGRCHRSGPGTPGRACSTVPDSARWGRSMCHVERSRAGKDARPPEDIHWAQGYPQWPGAHHGPLDQASGGHDQCSTTQGWSLSGWCTQ